mgnify:CR=1 FL=1
MGTELNCIDRRKKALPQIRTHYPHAACHCTVQTSNVPHYAIIRTLRQSYYGISRISPLRSLWGIQTEIYNGTPLHCTMPSCTRTRSVHTCIGTLARWRPLVAVQYRRKKPHLKPPQNHPNSPPLPPTKSQQNARVRKVSPLVSPTHPCLSNHYFR